jgi:hypothetical protein
LLQIFNIINFFILVKVKEAAVEIPTPNTSGGVYIPPTRRLQSAGGSSSSSSAASKSRTGSKKSCVKKDIFFLTLNTLIPGKKEKGAPDLSNQEYFPTLSAAVAIEQNNYKLKKYRFIWL